MFRFEKPQRVFEIGDVKVGGQPGELPTVVIGTMFYKGQRIVHDPNKGIFDKERAEGLIKKQEELSDITGNPFMLDVVGTSPESMVKYINFISDITDAPFLLDALPKTRITGLKHVVEVGLTQRVVYNSIWFPKENEVAAVRESGIEAAILLGYNPKNRWAKGVIDLLRGDGKEKGLLKIAEEIGIKKPLIDTCATNIPSIGVCSRAALLVKQEFGLPVGFSPGNAISTWKKKRAWELDVFKACDSSAQVIAQIMCCNFILYGPIEHAEWVFPAIAMADTIIATGTMELGTATLTKKHPLHILFPEFVEKLEGLRK